ncbi:MAG: hypothetical protein ABI868_22810 [Acidobacteriota bacterium]
MRKRLSLMLLSAAMVSSIGAFADVPPDAGAVGSSDTQARPGATTLRVRGTIDQYDASTRVLSLATTSGTMRLLLASTARIRQGWHKLDPLELRKLVGYRAAIGYSESAGNKTVESVHVFGRNERMER